MPINFKITFQRFFQRCKISDINQLMVTCIRFLPKHGNKKKIMPSSTSDI